MSEARRRPLAVAALSTAVVAALVAVTACSSARPLPPPLSSASSPSPLLSQPGLASSPAMSPSGGLAPSPTPSPAPVLPPSATRTIAHRFPVPGNAAHASYARTHHDYPATDIIAACGSTVISPVAGRILDTSTVDLYDPTVNLGSTRGGLSVSILGDDGVRYYGSHFSTVDPAIVPGLTVSLGQRLGQVGHTGNASVCHLHFGLSPPCRWVGDWWIQRGVVWPWSYLDSWRQGGNLSPVAVVAQWHDRNGCPERPLVDP